MEDVVVAGAKDFLKIAIQISPQFRQGMQQFGRGMGQMGRAIGSRFGGPSLGESIATGMRGMQRAGAGRPSAGAFGMSIGQVGRAAGARPQPPRPSFGAGMMRAGRGVGMMAGALGRGLFGGPNLGQSISANITRMRGRT